MTHADLALYEKTVKRLHRMGCKDPTLQIIMLAQEIDGYRQTIMAQQEELDRLHHRKKEPTQAKPDPVAEDHRHESADIVARFHCSACGIILEDVAAVVSYATYGETGYTSRSHRIKPARCPNCGRWFQSIQQKIIQPEVERQP